MGGIDVGRWIGGGLAAGALIWVLEGAGSLLYMDRTAAALADHGLAMAAGAGGTALTAAASLLAGLILVFFYAASRPRFGPGPKTAVLVAVMLWVGVYGLSLVGYGVIGIFPTDLLVMWGAVGLAAMILAGLLGGWIYREDAGPDAGDTREA